ncbi:hypothetical protein CFP56_011915 [Quercus suber]|uniref:Uncharacterized protein n=1 Tax=Quercus suber TaxID=58331 RepID=A0AAW0KZK4_QUESU
MCFSKLFPSRDAFAHRTLVRSELETPLERKNSILGKRVFSGLVVSTCGIDLTSWEIWVLLKPFSLRRLSTESGLSGFSKCTFWDVKRADFGDNPHEFMRTEALRTRERRRGVPYDQDTFIIENDIGVKLRYEISNSTSKVASNLLATFEVLLDIS